MPNFNAAEKALQWLLHLVAKQGGLHLCQETNSFRLEYHSSLEKDLRQRFNIIKAFMIVQSKIYFCLPIYYLGEIHPPDIVKNKRKPPKLRIF